MRTTYVRVLTKQAHADRFGGKGSFDGPGEYNKRSGYMMDMPQRDGVCSPMVMRDTPEYESPITGQPITSRSWRREDLKRSNCEEADGSLPKWKKNSFINERFCKKRGLRWDKDRWQDEAKRQKDVSADIDKNLFGKGL